MKNKLFFAITAIVVFSFLGNFCAADTLLLNPANNLSVLQSKKKCPKNKHRCPPRKGPCVIKCPKKMTVGNVNLIISEGDRVIYVLDKVKKDSGCTETTCNIKLYDDNNQEILLSPSDQNKIRAALFSPGETKTIGLDVLDETEDDDTSN